MFTIDIRYVDSDFKESDHPRGQPGNAGQFVKSGEGVQSTKGKKVAIPKAELPKQLNPKYFAKPNAMINAAVSGNYSASEAAAKIKEITSKYKHNMVAHYATQVLQKLAATTGRSTSHYGAAEVHPGSSKAKAAPPKPVTTSYTAQHGQQASTKGELPASAWVESTGGQGKQVSEESEKAYKSWKDLRKEHGPNDPKAIKALTDWLHTPTTLVKGITGYWASHTDEFTKQEVKTLLDLIPSSKSQTKEAQSLYQAYKQMKEDGGQKVLPEDKPEPAPKFGPHTEALEKAQAMANMPEAYSYQQMKEHWENIGHLPFNDLPQGSQQAMYDIYNALGEAVITKSKEPSPEQNKAAQDNQIWEHAKSIFNKGWSKDQKINALRGLLDNPNLSPETREAIKGLIAELQGKKPEPEKAAGDIPKSPGLTNLQNKLYTIASDPNTDIGVKIQEIENTPTAAQSSAEYKQNVLKALKAQQKAQEAPGADKPEPKWDFKAHSATENNHASWMEIYAKDPSWSHDQKISHINTEYNDAVQSGHGTTTLGEYKNQWINYLKLVGHPKPMETPSAKTVQAAKEFLQSELNPKAKISALTGLQNQVDDPSSKAAIQTMIDQVQSGIEKPKVSAPTSSAELPKSDGSNSHEAMLAIALNKSTSKEEKLRELQSMHDKLATPKNKVYAQKLIDALNAEAPAEPEAAAVPAPKPEDPYESTLLVGEPDLPEPFGGSKHQVTLYNIAKSNKDNSQKIKEIATYPTVKDYPNDYTAKYAKSLITALGGDPDKAIKKPVTPAASQPSTPSPYAKQKSPQTINVAQPSLKADKKTYAWAIELFDGAAKPSSIHSAEAKEICPSLKQEFWDGTPKNQVSAVKWYTDEGSQYINAYLRAQDLENISKSTVQKAHLVRDCFKRKGVPVTKDVVLRRGLSDWNEQEKSNAVKKWKQLLEIGGDAIYTADGHISASMADEAAFSGNLRFEMVVRKGTRALGVDTPSTHVENEVLLEHKQQFHVYEIQEKGGYTLVRMISRVYQHDEGDVGDFAMLTADVYMWLRGDADMPDDEQKPRETPLKGFGPHNDPGIFMDGEGNVIWDGEGAALGLPLKDKIKVHPDPDLDNKESGE